jgi:hypothetical protein
MHKDEVLEEIWEFRENYGRKFDFDLKKIGKDLMKKQALSKLKVVTEIKPRKTPKQA